MLSVFWTVMTTVLHCLEVDWCVLHCLEVDWCMLHCSEVDWYMLHCSEVDWCMLQCLEVDSTSEQYTIHTPTRTRPIFAATSPLI